MKIKKQEPKQENDYTALLKPIGTKQSAIEWYFKQMQSKEKFTQEEFDSIYKQAKEMEKQQIIDARVEAPLLNTESKYDYVIEPEQYYNQKFNK